ncbi:DUF3280 domain-containing protein [Rhodoblastus acidophilus]|uniref:DUF3280 domain-containing protein n=1 Tax=Candidatus Rhodoblastus alkanivorans TaxID=2954117 RepID=A0ABS9Z3T5_9HYPH|nr:DUF2380 domain-containing protein [Candidatus Rhodoblastus alkanivorans]MCI4680195.1 DUF3280 domain-containing protein [Candidatus Rhodoblastus alkanivorans]MCI4682283.1 DUF3280 domain-containing protein [Candidatus Rhodoblastus alkanivorans]MDI4639585.1 DUF3280 domain-containing protein [Rhodoblastus acidophilus]
MSVLWLAAVALPALVASLPVYAKAPPTPLLVMPFAFADGDAILQADGHADQVELMLNELRVAIDRKGVYRTISPEFTEDFISGDSARVLQRARDLGAAFVLAGAVQNVGAQASNVWLGLFDAADGRRLLHWQSTFRGDSDDSWRRAAAFLGDEVSASPPPY